MSTDGDDFLAALSKRPSFMFISPDTNYVAVVERVDPDRLPAYVAMARTRCLWCDTWCWLGDRSFELIASGGASPICQQCAVKVIPSGTQPIEMVTDTLRDLP